MCNGREVTLRVATDKVLAGAGLGFGCMSPHLISRSREISLSVLAFWLEISQLREQAAQACTPHEQILRTCPLHFFPWQTSQAKSSVARGWAVLSKV